MGNSFNSQHRLLTKQALNDLTKSKFKTYIFKEVWVLLECPMVLQLEALL